MLPGPLAATPAAAATVDAELGDEYELNQAGNRAAAKAQPAPKKRPNPERPAVRWACHAHVAKRKTGKASGWTLEVAGPFLGATADTAAESRSAFLTSYMNPATRRAAAPKRRLQQDDGDDFSLRRERRPTAPSMSYAEVDRARSGHLRAGPGRGHKDEAAARPLSATACEGGASLPLQHPVVDEAHATWLQQMGMLKKWQTARMEALAKTVAGLEGQIAQRDETIQRLRQKVCTNIALPTAIVNMVFHGVHLICVL